MFLTAKTRKGTFAHTIKPFLTTNFFFNSTTEDLIILGRYDVNTPTQFFFIQHSDSDSDELHE